MLQKLSKKLLFLIPVRRIHLGDYYVLKQKKLSTEIGSSAEIERIFTAEDVQMFSRLTGDDNPIHLDPETARRSRFDKPVVHGALINGVISAVIGTILPGNGSILLEQDLYFPNPLYVDELFRTRVIISERKRNIIFCRYECITVEGGKKVTEGMAKILFRPSHLGQ